MESVIEKFSFRNHGELLFEHIVAVDHEKSDKLLLALHGGEKVFISSRKVMKGMYEVI